MIVAVRSLRDGRYRDRLLFAILLSGGYSLFGLTNLVFSHDQTNTVFVLCFMVLVASTYQSAIGVIDFKRPDFAPTDSGHP